MLWVGGDLLSVLLLILLRGIWIHLILDERPYYDRSGDMALRATHKNELLCGRYSHPSSSALSKWAVKLRS